MVPESELSSNRARTSYEYGSATRVERKSPLERRAMAMSSIKSVNQNAEMVSRGHALAMNIASAKGLQDVVKTNLGPKGTLKM
jgi:hypothetical protein